MPQIADSKPLAIQGVSRHATNWLKRLRNVPYCCDPVNPAVWNEGVDHRVEPLPRPACGERVGVRGTATNPVETRADRLGVGLPSSFESRGAFDRGAATTQISWCQTVGWPLSAICGERKVRAPR